MKADIVDFVTVLIGFYLCAYGVPLLAALALD